MVAVLIALRLNALELFKVILENAETVTDPEVASVITLLWAMVTMSLLVVISTLLLA